MNRDDIIRMAREAGYSYSEAAVLDYDRHKRFAQLIAKVEREACAKTAEELIEATFQKPLTFNMIADAIRARGQA